MSEYTKQLRPTDDEEQTYRKQRLVVRTVYNPRFSNCIFLQLNISTLSFWH